MYLRIKGTVLKGVKVQGRPQNSRESYIGQWEGGIDGMMDGIRG